MNKTRSGAKPEMGSDGKWHAICWMVTAPAHSSILVDKEMDGPCKAWVLNLEECVMHRKGGGPRMSHVESKLSRRLVLAARHPAEECSFL
jgi:hypothetical protein